MGEDPDLVNRDRQLGHCPDQRRIGITHEARDHGKSESGASGRQLNHDVGEPTTGRYVWKGAVADPPWEPAQVVPADPVQGAGIAEIVFGWSRWGSGMPAIS